MAKRKTVPEIREIIIRLRKHQGIREIKRETGTHRKIIREVRDMAEKQGWLDENSPCPTEHEVQKAWEKCRGQEDKSHPLDNYHDEIRRWVKDSYSYVVMHQLLHERFSCSESTIRRYVQKHFKKPKPVIRRITEPGVVMEVDFGSLGLFFDPWENRRRRAWLFSARLRHSRHAYREIVYSQKQETFFLCHVHAFEHFGGVPEKVVCDNLKAAVIQASLESPLVNRAYRMLAEHYNFLISPCLPYHPEHKGGVESDIKYVKKNFLPLYKERQRQKGRETPYCDELTDALSRWEKETAEVRIVRGVGRSPIAMFEEEERVALKTLPKTRWDMVQWKECTVGPDWRIQCFKAYYTVPYRYIGKKVYACVSSQNVHIFHEFDHITTHRRAIRDWETVRKDEHAPPNQEEYLRTTSQGVLLHASKIGPYTKKAAEAIFSVRGVDGLRSARGLLRLGKKFSPARLEAACKRAVEYETATYQSVKDILKKGLDRDSPSEEPFSQLRFAFAREYGYFDPSRYT
jgi:transposase